jgi:hypothetical protein
MELISISKMSNENVQKYLRNFVFSNQEDFSPEESNEPKTWISDSSCEMIIFLDIFSQ